MGLLMGRQRSQARANRAGATCLRELIKPTKRKKRAEGRGRGVRKMPRQNILGGQKNGGGRKTAGPL